MDLFGSRVRYWTHGAAGAPTVVMVHGFRGNHIALSRIADEMTGLRVVVPDLPGFGESTPMTEIRHDVEGYCTFVKAFIAELGLSGSVLLGESFGSVIASRIAVSDPELLSDLILLNPIAVSPRVVNRPVCGLERGYYWLGANLPAPFAGLVIESRAINRLESLALLTAKDRLTRREVYRRRLYNLGFPQELRVIAEAFPDTVEKTAADDAESIPHRTLLIAGEKDAISPAEYQHRLNARLAQGTLVLIPGTGHFAPLETPSEAARAIAEFVG
jgi:pimeloyl-ACP methyl ester carboxylesterase